MSDELDGALLYTCTVVLWLSTGVLWWSSILWSFAHGQHEARCVWFGHKVEKSRLSARKWTAWIGRWWRTPGLKLTIRIDVATLFVPPLSIPLENTSWIMLILWSSFSRQFNNCSLYQTGTHNPQNSVLCWRKVKVIDPLWLPFRRPESFVFVVD